MCPRVVSGRLVPARATQEKKGHQPWPWPTISTQQLRRSRGDPFSVRFVHPSRAPNCSPNSSKHHRRRHLRHRHRHHPNQNRSQPWRWCRLWRRLAAQDWCPRLRPPATDASRQRGPAAEQVRTAGSARVTHTPGLLLNTPHHATRRKGPLARSLRGSRGDGARLSTSYCPHSARTPWPLPNAARLGLPNTRAE